MDQHVLFADEYSLHLTIESRRPELRRHTVPEACAAALDNWIRGGNKLPRSLAVSTTTAHWGDFRSVLKVLSKHSPPITCLRLGALTFPDYERGRDLGPNEDSDGSSWIVEVGSLECILRALPTLERLVVQANDIARLCSKPLVAPSLRTLCLRGAGLSRDLLASLARCTFPELDAMELWAGDLEYGWGGAATDFRELLELRRLPRLRHLAVMTDVADALIPVLAESSVLPALETLDLSCGAATDQGAHRLVENWRRFSHLTRMNLSGNFVTPAARNALMEVGSRVIVFGWQRWFDGGATLSMPPIVSLFKDWPEE